MSGSRDDFADMPSDSQPKPGDEAPAGTPGAGDNVCPDCAGKGRLPDGSSCVTCSGTGVVLTEIGGG